MKNNKIIPLLVACTLFTSGCSIGIEDIMTNKNGNEQSAAQTESDSQDFLLPSDTDVITEVDLSKFNETELKYAYAEIFARHGKIFGNENYSKYFNSQKWYSPNPKYSDSMLTKTERENAQYIDEYIKEHYTQKSEPTTTVTAPSAPSGQSSDTAVADKQSSDYIMPDSNTRRLTREELIGYSSDTLALMRNEIYARHGYVFQKEKYRSYFGSKSWYSPNPSFNGNGLSATEKYNVDLIKSME